MVHNLVKNAQEAVADQQDGGVTVRSHRVVYDERAYYEIRVEDNGPGFNESMEQHLFEPYATSKPKGTGLGLAIVKKIVEEHGGNIWAENSISGATLIVQLPMFEEFKEAVE